MSSAIKISVAKSAADKGLGEIYQSTALKMALLKKLSANEFERITPFVMCRDFLTDVLTYSKAKAKFKIYGMAFDGTSQSADFSGTYLQFQFPDKKTASNFRANLQYIHQIEKANGVPLSQIHDLGEQECLLEGDASWSSSCLKFSLYTLLLRSFCMPVKGEGFWLDILAKTPENTDAALLKSVKPSVWKTIFKDLNSISTDTFCGYKEINDQSIRDIHHTSGFISVFGWHRELAPERLKKNMHFAEMHKRGFALHEKSVNTVFPAKK